MQNKKRWVYLSAGTFILLFLGMIYAWSIFKKPFNDIFPSWSVSNLSLTFTISMTFFCIGGFAAGLLLKKINSTQILWIVAALMATGLYFVSTLNPNDPNGSLIKLYVFYGVFCGAGSGMGYNIIIATISKYFRDMQGTASGALMMGFALGGIILGSAINSMINSIGIFSSFRVTAIAMGAVVFMGSFFIKTPKAEILPISTPNKNNLVSADGSTNTVSKILDISHSHNYTTKQMLSTKAFWIYILWSIVQNSAGLLVINSAASIALYFGAPAVVGLLVSIFNGVGRFSIGALFDKFGRKKTMLVNVIILLVSGILLLLASTINNLALIITGILIAGVSYGGNPAISSTFTSTKFGQANFSMNFGVVNFALIPASIIGPMISSFLIESSGGAYDTTFIMMIVLAVLSFIAWTFLNRYENE